MNDGIEPRNWHSPRGPWHEADGVNRIYDAGETWCLNRGGHPTRDRDYPDHHLHIPFDECQSAPTSIHDVRDALTGVPRILEMYVARPFLFGQQRSGRTDLPAVPRIVWDCFADSRTLALLRFSMPAGEALRMARTIGRLTDLIA